MKRSTAMLYLGVLAAAFLGLASYTPPCTHGGVRAAQTAASGAIAQSGGPDESDFSGSYDGSDITPCPDNFSGPETSYQAPAYETWYSEPVDQYDYGYYDYYQPTYDYYYSEPGYSGYTTLSPSYVQQTQTTPSGYVSYTQPSLQFTAVPVGTPGPALTPSTPQTQVQVVQQAQPQTTVQTVRPVNTITQIVAPAPTCSISVNPAPIGTTGWMSLEWTSWNASSAYLSPGGSVPVQSAYYTVPYTSASYTLTVYDAYGRSGQCSTWTQDTYYYTPSYQLPACSISVYPSQITAGDSATLAWSSINATSASLSELGAIGTSGSYTVAPAQTRSYSLTVYGPGGTQTCSTSLAVSAAPTPPPSGPKAPTCSLTADSSSIFAGATTTLRWKTTGADTATLTGAGAVKTSGSLAVAPASTQTYTLSVQGAGGSKTCSVKVMVETPSSCTVTCNGVTYACAPIATPVAAQCPTTAVVQQSWWDWFVSLFK